MDGRASEVSTAANVTTAFHRFSNRRFSFSLCWLLSKFTTGIEMIGNENVSAKGAIGTVPPIVRICTGGSFHVRCMTLVISTETGWLISVRYAFVPENVAPPDP